MVILLSFHTKYDLELTFDSELASGTLISNLTGIAVGVTYNCIGDDQAMFCAIYFDLEPLTWGDFIPITEPLSNLVGFGDFTFKSSALLLYDLKVGQELCEQDWKLCG